MKRNFKLLVAVLVLAVMVLTLASCDVVNGVIDKIKPHEHEYSADWSSDATNHWHAALCDDAEPADVAAHTFAEGVCSVCGYEKPVEETPVCTHEAMTSEVVKEATCTEAGEKKFTCTDCGYSYTQEIAILDHTIEKLEAVEPTCTETGLGKGEKCSVCGTILKAQSVIDTIPHEFVDGLCTFGCGNIAEGYEWAEVVYTLLPDELEEFSSTADGELRYLGTDGFFTVICKSGTKIDYFDADNHSAKVFEDGFEATKRLSLNGKINWKDGKVTKTGMEITVNSAATVKIWWVAGDAGRYVAIQDVTKTSKDFVAVSAKTEEVAKGELLIDTFELPEAGSYYIGNQVGNNYYAKIEVTTKTLVKVEDNPSGPSTSGNGTYSEPYILPETGDYTTDAAGLVFYQYTVLDDGYVTVSSDWADGSVWIKVGTDINALNDNQGDGSIEYFATKGSVVYIAVSDRNEVAESVPFKVSFEKVALGSVEAFVGSWKLEVSNWFGTTTYIFNINEDGTGTVVEKSGFSEYSYDLSAIVVDGVAIVNLVDDNDNTIVFNITYDSENDSYTAVNNMMGISGELLPYDGETDEPKPEVSYDTVIVIGANTLYFSADEIAANAANRTLTISVAGNYMFKGDLFVSSIVDSTGNAIAKNSDYSYTLAEGEYTVSFGMFSIFGVQADSACGLNVEEVVPGGNEGGNEGGGEGDDGDETYTEPFDSLKDSLEGEYKFDNYNVYMMYNGFEAAYYANVYAYAEDGSYLYDLYFTYEVTANDDGSYTLTLTYASRPDYEYGTDYVDTVLGYEIVLGGETPEPDACEHEFEENIFYHPEMVSATCTTPGVAVFECTKCDYYYTEATPVDPTAHGWNTEESVVTAATCTENGVMSVTCLDCNATWQEDIYASHDLEETIVSATCTTDGSYYAECKNCDYEESNVIPANGHINWYITCGQSGECMECGVEFTKGHDVDPCEGGMCFNCWETIAPSHTWVNATCTAPKTCSACNATEGEALGHDYDNIPHDATCTAGGYVEHICALCDHTYNDGETESLGHADENGDFKCDRCSTKMLPADGEALTIPQALAIAKLAGSSYTTQKYYITGIVTNLYNTQYGNFYIKDADGNQICIYGLYSYDGTIRYDAMSYKPVEGDEVTVYTVLGAYNTTYQGKNAWLDEVVAHVHNYVAVDTAATCLNGGYTTHTCSICMGSYVDSETEALGHTTESGKCERCGLEIGGDAPVIGTLAEFTFGSNGSAAHVDGNSYSSGKSWTVGSYTLKLDNVSSVYGPAYDAQGNSCIKLGTSSKTGSFSFTVDENVTEVVIYVAQYKANTTKITVNGASYTISGASNNGAYDTITIDTSVNKTVSFTTVSGGVRCMIDGIVFNGYAN